MDAFIGGAWRTITKAEAYIAGKWRTLTNGEAYIDDAWSQVASFIPPLSVSINPGTAYGFASPLKPIAMTVTTDFLRATPAGGKAPFTYAWSITSHTGSLPTIGYPSSAQTNASATVARDSEQTATTRVTVTDALGSTATATGSFDFINQSQIG